MIEYALEDIDGTQYELTGTGVEVIPRNSLSYSGLSLDYETRIIEKTYLPGSYMVGSPRVTDRSIDLTLERTGDNFETQLNTLLYNLLKAVYLIDLTNSRRIRIAPSKFKLKYGKGSHRLYSSETIDVDCLDPFWEDVTETSIEDEDLTGDSDNDISINNTGYLDAYGRLVFTASSNVSKIQAYMTGIKEGIEVKDNLFGGGSYTELEINNYNGSITLRAGSDEYDRTAFITPGSGYFRFPVGNNTLRIYVDEDCTVDIYYRKRYYE